VLGLSATTENADAAWDFVSWTLSDEAQVEVLAKNKDIVGRTDLANNKYAKTDPRVVTINQLVAKGETPYSLNFGATYNDPNGPWIKIARDAVFGTDVDKAVSTGAQTLSESLAQ
jgi:multiple sugar transport system substrate-binding protein